MHGTTVADENSAVPFLETGGGLPFPQEFPPSAPFLRLPSIECLEPAIYPDLEELSPRQIRELVKVLEAVHPLLDTHWPAGARVGTIAGDIISLIEKELRSRENFFGTVEAEAGRDGITLSIITEDEIRPIFYKDAVGAILKNRATRLIPLFNTAIGLLSMIVADWRGIKGMAVDHYENFLIPDLEGWKADENNGPEQIASLNEELKERTEYLENLKAEMPEDPVLTSAPLMRKRGRLFKLLERFEKEISAIKPRNRFEKIVCCWLLNAALLIRLFAVEGGKTLSKHKDDYFEGASLSWLFPILLSKEDIATDYYESYTDDMFQNGAVTQEAYKLFLKWGTTTQKRRVFVRDAEFIVTVLSLLREVFSFWRNHE